MSFVYKQQLQFNTSSMIDYCMKPFNPGIELYEWASGRKDYCVYLLKRQINACPGALNSILANLCSCCGEVRWETPCQPCKSDRERVLWSV